MFTGIDMLIAIIITSVLVGCVCLFMLGASTLNKQEEAYSQGYYKGYNKGYEDGKKVGGAR